ncbi:Cna B-type domain-containing protein [Porcipelethomonas sp.]|uniref:Cna B-type domain-containing protein n=1 Tax=Porcipelethomonas sp. TaxID=2981675 RepID=UPI003EF1A02E
MKKKISKYLIICLTLIIFSCFPVSAEGDKADTLTITCQKEDVVLSDMTWSIYRVADISSGKKYTFTETFSKYPVSINNLSTSQLQAAAVTLETYVQADKITPLKTGKTNEDGKIVFSGLDFGLYLITGESVVVDDMYYMPSPSLVELSDDDSTGIDWRYDVNTVPKLKVMPASMRIYNFDCTVKKIWTNDDVNSRPESVKAVLLKNGVEYDSAVLNESNNWENVWENLSSEYKWSVVEENVPANYNVTYTENEIMVNNNIDSDKEFVINNTYAPVPVPVPVSVSAALTEPVSVTSAETNTQKLPQTGQLWWPVPVMSAAGLIMLSAGWKINSDKRHKNEK